MANFLATPNYPMVMPPNPILTEKPPLITMAEPINQSVITAANNASPIPMPHVNFHTNNGNEPYVALPAVTTMSLIYRFITDFVGLYNVPVKVLEHRRTGVYYVFPERADIVKQDSRFKIIMNSRPDCTPDEEVTRYLMRPRNAWIIYRQYWSTAIRAISFFIPAVTISGCIARRWETESLATRMHFQHLADNENARYKLLFPDYIYEPLDRKTVKARNRDISAWKNDVLNTLTAKKLVLGDAEESEEDFIFA